MRVEITTHTAGVLAQIETGQVRGLALAAEHVLTTSQPRVPVDEATLQRSGRTDVDAGARRSAISYGSPGAEAYAVKQHEDLTLRHPSGGGAKFLESALLQSRQEIADIVAAQVRRALR
jgi:hypothetical protein